jgi:hypothetical protein
MAFLRDKISYPKFDLSIFCTDLDFSTFLVKILINGTFSRKQFLDYHFK